MTTVNLKAVQLPTMQDKHYVRWDNDGLIIELNTKTGQWRGDYFDGYDDDGEEISHQITADEARRTALSLDVWMQIACGWCSIHATNY